MKQRLIIVPCLVGVSVLTALLSGCQSSQSSQSSISPAEKAAFKGSPPPANMAQEIQTAQQNWQKRHPTSASAPGVPGPAGKP